MAPQDDLTAERAAIIGKHYECEDPWYSCPLSEDGCANDAEDKTKCNCGRDARRQRLDDLLKQTRQEALREAADIAFDHACEDPRFCMCNSVIYKALDRLASEGG